MKLLYFFCQKGEEIFGKFRMNLNINEGNILYNEALNTFYKSHKIISIASIMSYYTKSIVTEKLYQIFCNDYVIAVEFKNPST